MSHYPPQYYQQAPPNTYPHPPNSYPNAYPPQNSYPPQAGYPANPYPPQSSYPSQNICTSHSYPAQQAPPAHPYQLPNNQYPPSNQYPASSYVNQSSIPGARGDGISDDTAAIQAAINNTPIGGQLCVLPGTYSIKSHIKIDKPITITGTGGIIQCDMQVKDWTHMITVRTDNCTFDGVQFYNKSGNEGIGVISIEGNNFKITNCVMDNFYEGIMLGKMVTHGVAQVFHSYIQITNNKFLNIHGVTGGSICHGDAIAFFGCTDVIISNNFITAAPGKSPRNGINSGPEGYIRSTRVTISNNQVLGDWDYPITTEWGTHCQILNNKVDGKFISGIIERGDEILVSGNQINVQPGKRDGNVHGIHFYGVDNGTISNNTITGAGKYAIYCTPSHETQKGNNTQIMDNTIDGEFFYGIYFGDTDHSKVYRNNIRTTHKEKSCMGIHGWQNKDLCCADNFIQAPNGTAVIFIGTKGGEIVRNKTANTRCGVYLGKDTAGIQVASNDFTCTTCAFDKHPETRDIQSC